MSYLNVITLERAKNYLRVDLDFDTDDAEITSMISASCRYVEKRTNHILYARDIVYNGTCQVKVYDYPINSIVTDPAPFKVDFASGTDQRLQEARVDAAAGYHEGAGLPGPADGGP